MTTRRKGSSAEKLPLIPTEHHQKYKESHKDTDIDLNDNENGKSNHHAKKYPYPKGVPFIISTEFCERFSFYGMKTVLSLYMTQMLGFNENEATMLYHGFNFLCYFTPLLGAIIADSFFGKFKTILYLSIVYAIGEVILTIGSIGDTKDGNQGIDGLPAGAMSFIGLALIGLGTGGIKPCVSAFGGEQFKVPAQSAQITTFFSIFYASINGGSLISTLLTPILHKEVKCFGQDSCFALSFGVPSVLMVAAVLVFASGRIFNLYKTTMPEENIIVKTAKCIWCSFTEKRKRGKKEDLPEMLDYAEDKYGKDFVCDVKALKNVSYMFLPFPLFWALFDQQGSRWLFQATRCDGNLFGYQVPPDSFQAINPIMILLFIPLFDFLIYPLLAKFSLCRTDLQRIVTGGALAGVAFIVSGGLELRLAQTYPVLPETNMMHLSVYNGLQSLNNSNSCPGFDSTISIMPENGEEINIPLEDTYPYVKNVFIPEQTYSISVPSLYSCGNKNISFDTKTFSPPSMSPDCKDGEECESRSQSVLFSLDLNQNDGKAGLLWGSEYRERLDKSIDGYPYIKTIWNVQHGAPLTFKIQSEVSDESLTYTLDGTNDIVPETFAELGKVTLMLMDSPSNVIYSKETTFNVGGNYQILIQYTDEDDIFSDPIIIHEITKPNQLSTFWQLPQIMIITAGEIMFSITSLKFAFSQAPDSMKAVIMAISLMTNAIGNVITLLLTLAFEKIFDTDELAYNFFIFAGLMFVDMIILAWMATGYKYVDYNGDSSQYSEDDDDNASLDKI